MPKAIQVTTEVCPHHFHLTDEEVEKTNFSTNVKMHPPLRTQQDVDAMIAGLKDGQSMLLAPIMLLMLLKKKKWNLIMLLME